MADQVISSATIFPQDEGFGSIADGNEPWTSAGYVGGLAQAVGESGYVHASLGFTGHSSANDTVTVDPGRAFVFVSNAGVQSTTGGASSPSYDTSMTADVPVMVNVPQSVTGVSLQGSTVSSVWLAYDTDGTGPSAAGTAYIRSDDTGMVSAPSHPNVTLGGANPDDASADTRTNDNPTETFKSLTTDDFTTTNEPSLTGGLDAFGNISLVDSGSTTISSNSASAVASGHTFSSQPNQLLPLAHPDTGETNSNNNNEAWIWGAGGTSATSYEIEVGFRNDGTYRMVLRNETATTYTFHWTLWEIAP